jgi:pimeloyl-ACP methyl ester carboxylesterase
VSAPLEDFANLGRCRRVALPTLTLNVWEYGVPDGIPVFYFHGWPSSGSDAMMSHAAASALGIRLVSPDRPGIGGSDFQEDRTVSDWPPLVASLADALGWERFHILAISGGAMYGYATAHAMPRRVRALGVVCGALPLAELGDSPRMHPAYRILQWLYRKNSRWPLELLRLLAPAAQIRWPRWAAWPLIRTLPEVDRATLRIPLVWRAVATGVTEGFRQGASAAYLDALPNIRPLGFSLRDIRIPVHLWHGGADRNFAWQEAATVASQIPGAQFHLREQDGHFSLACRHTSEALAQLISGATDR